MPDSLSIKEINRNKRSQSIPALLKKIVGEIELVGWLSPNDREQMINAFISDLAHRFNHTRDLISPKLSAAQNRRIIMKLFERIGRIKNSIIEKCHMRKVAMDELGIFAEEANSARVISTFRTELSRRINTSDLVEEILNELEGKEIVLEQTTIDNADALNQQVQEFKDALDSVIHPIPKLEPPQMSLKRQKTAMKQKMLQESANPEAKPADDYEDDHKGSAFYKSKLENTVSAMRAMRTPGINTVRQEDAVANIGLIEDMAEIVARNASQLQAGSLVHVDDEVAAVEKTEDPLLQAHHSVSGPLASAKRQEPAAAVSEFGSEVDPKKIDVLDEKLTRYKEIEELYSEITTPITSNHLETDDNALDITGCPAAPYDPKMPMSNAFKGIVASYKRKYKTIPESSEIRAPDTGNTQTPTNNTDADALAAGAFAETPEIRLTTRKFAKSTVTADEFVRNRAAAMRMTVSSRYNTFKYNYGGYAPLGELKKKKKPKKIEIFCHEDYLDYIQQEARAFQAAMEEEANRKLAEEALRKEQKKEDERKERKRRRTLYSRGKWNVGALTYMREIQQVDDDEYFEDIDLEGHRNEASSQNAEAETTAEVENTESQAKTNYEQEASKVSDPAGTPDTLDVLNKEEVVLAQLEVAAKKPKVHRAKSDTDISAAQMELEQLWVALKMPLDQKLDMAIKYGSRKFGSRLELASEKILSRESLLNEIEEFEKEASNPDRYFMNGYEGSSEARMKEAKIRDRHLALLHKMEEDLTALISTIKFELNETEYLTPKK
ncbi:Coiled-coil domain-containing protein 87 [Entophlyctis luteolus]|nr:Coiled-coil domain-containing protein 87 [Entophlyctis luteolus]